MRTRIVYDDACSTAYATYNTGLGLFEIHLGVAFYEQLNADEAIAVLQHEAMHIAFGHLDKNAFAGKNHGRLNTAMDMEINGYIDHLPAGARRGREINLADFLGTEVYYQHLPDEDPQGDAGGGDVRPSDDPEVGRASATIVKEAMGAMSTAEKEKMAGKTPATIQRLLEKYFGAPQVSWKNLLRRALQRATNAPRVATWKRFDRRLGEGHKGKKKGLRPSALVLVDQSASVSDTLVSQFFAEIDNLANNCDVSVAVFDAEVHPPVKYRRGQRIERACYGGTSFDAAFAFADKWCKSSSVSSIVLLTDGGDTFTRLPKAAPLVVVTTDGSSFAGSTATVVVVNE